MDSRTLPRNDPLRQGNLPAVNFLVVQRDSQPGRPDTVFADTPRGYVGYQDFGTPCSLSLRKGLSQLGIDMRAGIQTGQVEIRDGEVGGLTVHSASRVMNVAESGGVMIPGTVKNLAIGSPLDFSHCGPFELKGIPGQWNLYEANASSLDE